MQLVSLLIIAAAYWGHVPACGQPSVVVADLPVPVVGVADLARCRIELDGDLFGAAGWACMTTVHEYGHLLGLPHSPDPANVMYPLLRKPTWPCAW